MAGKHTQQLLSKLSASSISLDLGSELFFPNEGTPAHTDPFRNI